MVEESMGKYCIGDDITLLMYFLYLNLEDLQWDLKSIKANFLIYKKYVKI